MKFWWCEKGTQEGGRKVGGRGRKKGDGGRGRKKGDGVRGRDTNSQVTLASLLEGKTQNSEVLMLGLHSLLSQVKKGTRLSLSEGEGGRNNNSTICGFSTGPSSNILCLFVSI